MGFVINLSATLGASNPKQAFGFMRCVFAGENMLSLLKAQVI